MNFPGFRVEGLRQEKIFNYQEAKYFLNMGNRNRHSSETKQNPNSSRSHAIFTIYCNIRHKYIQFFLVVELNNKNSFVLGIMKLQLN